MDLAIPTKLDNKLVGELDRLVSEGFYVSRSEAIREAVRRLVAEHYISLQRFIRVIAEIASEILKSNLASVITDVVLFGSVARGDATLESDIDLLILIEHEDASRVRRKSHKIIYPISLVSATPITLIIMNREEFIEWIKDELNFAREIKEEGIQLYGDVLSLVRN
ncbi:MAG: putative nickel-responsive regulator [Candidatus Bathyarchaeota archaeon BA2]|nr:MAG: putative nickel-responsive regulator [Candidatus Bathyarchaeota archaeon BA2]